MHPLVAHGPGSYGNSILALGTMADSVQGGVIGSSHAITANYSILSTRSFSKALPTTYNDQWALEYCSY